MWTPVSLKVTNFRSVVEENFEFNNQVTELLQGINKTDEGFESNGSGKSSFRESLAYVLGLPVYAATLSDLINNYADEVEVRFEAINKKLSLDLMIVRKTPQKGSTQLTIHLNGTDQRDKFSSVLEGDRFIIETLGLPKEDILNHFIISKEKFTSFFSSSDTSKKELINRFSKADLIDNIEDVVTKDLILIEKDIINREMFASKTSGKIEVLQEQLQKELDIDFEKKKEGDLKDLNDKLMIYTEKKKSLLEGLEKEEKKLLKHQGIEADIESEIKTKEEEKLKKSKQIDLISPKKEKLLNELTEYKSFLREINTQISGSVKCPECSYEFNPGEDIDIVEARKSVTLVEKTISRLEEDLKSVTEEIQKHDGELKGIKSKIRSLNTELDENNNQISFCRRMVKTLNNQVSENDLDVLETEEKIKLVEGRIRSDKESEIRESIKSLEVELADINSEIETLKERQFETNQWSNRFKKFKGYLANKSLTNIQGFTNLYLQKMRTNLSVRLEGFKQNKDGSIREKITPTILRNGIVEGSFKKFSGGERGRIDVAITLAMRHLINNASPTGGLDLFWIDEITEGLDGLGIENLAESINELGITSIITSHVKHEKNYPNIITAVKVNGETKLLTN